MHQWVVFPHVMRNGRYMTQEDMRYVAGHGLVPWPAGRVTQHAQYVWSTHRPDKELLELCWWQQHLPYLSVRRRRWEAAT